MLTLIGLVRKEPGTIYGIDFPDFPGCISADETWERCRVSGPEALEACILLMRDEGMAMPTLRSPPEIMADPDSAGSTPVAITIFADA